MRCYLVLVTMQFSDDVVPDVIFGPFATRDDAYQWKFENVDGRHFSRVQETDDPTKDYGEHAWWKTTGE
jgi:hypothetical protein